MKIFPIDQIWLEGSPVKLNFFLNNSLFNLSILRIVQVSKKNDKVNCLLFTYMWDTPSAMFRTKNKNFQEKIMRMQLGDFSVVELVLFSSSPLRAGLNRVCTTL